MKTDEIINECVRQMSTLYIMYCLPRMVFDKQTHEFSLEYSWTNEDAKQLFEQYQERHQEQLVELQTRSAQLPLEPSKSIQAGTWDCKDDGYTNHLGDATCFICGRPRLS